MNKYVAIVIVIVLGFLGFVIAYMMSPTDVPGATDAQAQVAKDH